MKKRYLIFTLAVLLVMGLLSGCTRTVTEDEEVVVEETHEPVAKIGVALWSSTDVLGSRCREVILDAAEALDVEVEFTDHGFSHQDEALAVRQLIDDGCQGIVLCNSSDEELEGIIKDCDASGTYLAQCFRSINRDAHPGVYALAEASPCYVGCVHENEIENGRNTAQMIINLGKRRIGVLGWMPGDTAWEFRMEGYSIAVEGANRISRDKPVILLDPVYAGITYEGGYRAVDELIKREPAVDALIVAGGGGEPLVGAMAAISDNGLDRRIAVVATDFVDDLDERMKSGTMVGASGGTHCDSLLAFMMVYNAVMETEGYTDLSGTANEIIFPYLYAISPQDYADFEKNFFDVSPYTGEEFIELSGLSVDGLMEEASGFKKKW